MLFKEVRSLALRIQEDRYSRSEFALATKAKFCIMKFCNNAHSKSALRVAVVFTVSIDEQRAIECTRKVEFLECFFKQEYTGNPEDYLNRISNQVTTEIYDLKWPDNPTAAIIPMSIGVVVVSDVLQPAITKPLK
ncbi:hypothetical protein FGIG_07171 [Fasciola gigantica]|uniref:Uncharacterized protein n=1 Tax=Fasciola gigantica TaxID=46835 RepID=A0A504YQ32_FASGI|nr:hypothetical protein FGIG_07171 [Fasciola gigantica]